MRFPLRNTLIGGLAATILLAAPVSAVTWGPVRTLNQQGVLVDGRSLAASGALAHVVYTAATGLSYRRSTDGGSSWKAPIVLAKSQAPFFYGLPVIAASGTSVYVLFLGTRAPSASNPGNQKLWLRRSLDGGNTWHKRQLIASGPSSSLGQASVAVAGNHAYIAWTSHQNGGIEMRQSVDNGVSWDGPFTQGITLFDGGAGLEGSVHLAASGSNAYLAWIQGMTVDYNGRGIKLRRTNDGGAIWKGLQTLVPNTLDMNGGFTLAASGKYLLASYRLDPGQIGIARSSDAGKTLTHGDVVTGSGYGQHAVSLRGAQARLIYVAKGLAPSIRYLTSASAGAHWAGSKLAVKTPTGVRGVSVAESLKGTVMAWLEDSYLFTSTPIHTRFGA